MNRAFRNHVARSATVVADHPEKIALLGFVPDRSEPAYGYIEPARALRIAGTEGVFRVAAFHEKPSREHASTIIRRGGLWNAFIMTLRARHAVELIRRVRLDDHDRMRRVHSTAAADGHTYAALPAWNFSSDFLARIPRHLLVQRVADMMWSDWGTPQAIARTFASLKESPSWMNRYLAIGEWARGGEQRDARGLS